MDIRVELESWGSGRTIVVENIVSALGEGREGGRKGGRGRGRVGGREGRRDGEDGEGGRDQEGWREAGREKERK